MLTATEPEVVADAEDSDPFKSKFEKQHQTIETHISEKSKKKCAKELIF
jgi:hypothetical protein